ncbi:MAG: EamA family transporter [Devosia sp.]|uniref:DMT family transporter n=1 Tax=Devosia sp. TaxID=1871048 RepID=UPI001A49E09B|nr:DMT family transporter [Devosia sp.]MBL8597250.1 EamA family transporter [Devosia sp.]
MSEPSPASTGAFSALMSRPYILLILCNLFWGGNVVAGKAAVGNIDPYALMVLRWAGAALLVLPFAIEPVRRDWPTIRAKWWLYLFYGAVGYATFNALCYVAAYYTSGFNIGLDQVTINIFVMLLSFILFRTRVRPLQLVGVAITIVGVALTASHGDLSRILALDINFGDLLVLIASLAYAVYSITLRWRPQTDWRSFLLATFIGAALASLVFAATAGGGLAYVASTVPSITPLGWIIAAYTMVLPSIISQMFYVRGVELIGANRASLFINLIPLFGAAGSVLILGERLETFHFIAAALVMSGIVLAEWSARRA